MGQYRGAACIVIFAAAIVVAGCNPQQSPGATPAPATPGACTAQGKWAFVQSNGSHLTWTIDPDGAAVWRESGGRGTGTAWVETGALKMNYTYAEYAGTYDLAFSPDCQKASGSMTLTRAPAGEDRATVQVNAERYPE